MDLLNLTSGLNFVVSIFIKILFGLVTVLAFLMGRQVVLMDRVVNISIGGMIKNLVMGFGLICLFLTVAVILIA